MKTLSYNKLFPILTDQEKTWIQDKRAEFPFFDDVVTRMEADKDEFIDLDTPGGRLLLNFLRKEGMSARRARDIYRRMEDG